MVLFTIWTISTGVDVDLGGVLATGTQEGRQAGKDFGVALVLGSNAIL